MDLEHDLVMLLLVSSHFNSAMDKAHIRERDIHLGISLLKKGIKESTRAPSIDAKLACVPVIPAHHLRHRIYIWVYY